MILEKMQVGERHVSSIVKLYITMLLFDFIYYILFVFINYIYVYIHVHIMILTEKIEE